MNNRPNHPLSKLSVTLGLLLLLEAPGMLRGEPPSASALAAFDTYTDAVEARLNQQHLSPTNYLSPAPQSETPTLERIPTPLVAGALLHHWRATVFLPNAQAAAFERLLCDFDDYPRIFAPEVLSAHSLSPTEASLRIRQHHVLTVVLDTTYAIAFTHLDPQHGASISRSLRVAEVAQPGTPAEHPLTPAQDHGFLWRQNTYWSWSERAAGPNPGLTLQVESISLTRAVPTGLGWAVHPYLESIPRESLAFTLRAAATALTQQPHSERTTR